MNIFIQMKEEHSQIKQLLKCMQHASIALMNNEPFHKDDWKTMLDFIQSYVEDYHHRKEESLIFTKIPNTAENQSVLQDVLEEHDRTRYHVRMLKDALQRFKPDHRDEDRLYVITHAMAYVDNMQRHIDHEDFLIFPLIQNQMQEEVLETIEIEHFKFNQMIHVEALLHTIDTLMKTYKITRF